MVVCMYVCNSLAQTPATADATFYILRCALFNNEGMAQVRRHERMQQMI